MKYIKYLSVAAACVMSLTSCSDFLDSENKSSGGNDADKYFAENPELLIPTAYESLRNFGVNIGLHDYAGDLYTALKEEGDNDYQKFINNNEDGSVKSYYSNGFKAIQYANELIHYGGEGSECSEHGRFLRAYVYYLLTQQFGGVPYITHYIQDANRDYPRTDLNEIYTSVCEDLEDLYANSKLPAQSHQGKASKQAVAALLAKLYLAAAWDIDTKLVDEAQGTYTVVSKDRFKKADQWAEKAINGVQLTMSFADKWDPKKEGNAEEIFSIQYSREGLLTDAGSSGHTLQTQYSAYFGDCQRVGLKPTKGGSDMLSAKARYLFEKGDERFEATFMTTFYNAKKVTKEMAAWGTEGYYAYYNCSEAELAKMPIALKVFPWYYTDAEIEAWLTAHKDQCKKFDVSTYGLDKPFAFRLESDEITKWEFSEDGSWTKSTVRASDFFASGSGFQGVCVKKWDDPETPQATASNCYRDIVTLHVSQMYLVSAEAKLLQDDKAGALARINAVRKRAKAKELSSFGAYAPDYVVSAKWQEKEIDLLLDEYAREMYGEQTRYADLRRTKQYIRYNLEFNRNIKSIADMQNPRGETKWYRPIPAAEFDFNTALDSSVDQNPGY